MLKFYNPLPTKLFLVNLKYDDTPLEEIDEKRAGHLEFLTQNYAKGKFLMSGKKEPRTGGVILVKVGSREELENILEQDPFKQAGLARYKIIQFEASMITPGLNEIFNNLDSLFNEELSSKNKSDQKGNIEENSKSIDRTVEFK